MSERARALEQARETALRTDATYLSPSGRIVRVQGHRLTGQIIVDSRGRVAVRNIDTDRLSYVHESDLRELAVDPPPSGASSQAETVAKLLLAARQVASFARAWEPLSPGDIRDLTKAIEAMDALPAPVSPVEPTPEPEVPTDPLAPRKPVVNLMAALRKSLESLDRTKKVPSEETPR